MSIFDKANAREREKIKRQEEAHMQRLKERQAEDRRMVLGIAAQRAERERQVREARDAELKRLGSCS